MAPDSAAAVASAVEVVVAGDRTLVLIAGPSGSGKSHLAKAGANGTVAWLALDEFYRDETYPNMPQTLGIIDWDDVASWDLDAAMLAIETLLTEGVAEVPCYEISLNRRVGTRRLDARNARVLLAEGIFAADVFKECLGKGINVKAIWLDRPRGFNFVRRLARDLKDRRKPPLVLVRRGFALLRAEPGLRARALTKGFVPLSMREAQALLATLTR